MTRSGEEANTDPTDREQFAIEAQLAGERLDVVVNSRMGWNSRSRVKDAIKLGILSVNGRAQKPSYRLREGDEISIETRPQDEPDHLVKEDLPLEILHEDASMLVVNKAAFMTVHPGAGHRTGTLVNALAHHFDELSDVGGPLRPGIVHRLDRETSGALCVAKSNRAHYAITSQFQARTVEKTYLAVAEGRLEFDEYLVDEPIGRHPQQPTKMAIVEGGRASSTRFEVIERFENFTYVRCFPKTGRTHQIRLHLAHLGHPIACDKLYGKRQRMARADLTLERSDEIGRKNLLDRQALHAHRLCLDHPLTGQRITFEAPIPADMQEFLDLLGDTRRTDNKGSDGFTTRA